MANVSSASPVKEIDAIVLLSLPKMANFNTELLNVAALFDIR